MEWLALGGHGGGRNEKWRGVMSRLDGRQRRELDFYEERARQHVASELSLDPVLGRERRLWNSYWSVYELAISLFRAGVRRALDFGCGQGDAAVRLAHVGYEVFGFDISPSNIRIAAQLAQQYGFRDRVHFSVQLAENLAYPGDFFDFLVGFDILHHVEIPQAIAEAMRVLRPGGTAVFREHLAVPVLDRLRQSFVGRWLVPIGPSQERHVTADERKLTAEDIKIIRGACYHMELRSSALLSRLDILLRRPGSARPSLMEQLDYRLFNAFPFMRRWGGSGVLILRKAGEGEGLPRLDSSNPSSEVDG